MSLTKELVLIEGVFQPEEAHKLLDSFLSKKINYHHLEIFSVQEQNVHADISSHERRIQELKAARKSLQEIIITAKQNHQKLMINSIIKIEFVNE